jgi:hypothetical protein
MPLFDQCAGCHSERESEAECLKDDHFCHGCTFRGRPPLRPFAALLAFFRSDDFDPATRARQERQTYCSTPTRVSGFPQTVRVEPSAHVVSGFLHKRVIALPFLPACLTFGIVITHLCLGLPSRPSADWACGTS